MHRLVGVRRSKDAPISVRKPNGECFTIEPGSIRHHSASTDLTPIFVCRDLMGRDRTFRPCHAIGRLPIVARESGPTGAPTGIRFQEPDNTERDQRELDAILRRIARLEAELAR